MLIYIIYFVICFDWEKFVLNQLVINQSSCKSNIFKVLAKMDITINRLKEFLLILIIEYQSQIFERCVFIYV